MHDEDEARPPALQSSQLSASPSGRPPSPAPQGLDWRAFRDALLNLIGQGKKLGGELEAATQTPADDVLVGKVGIVTAPVSIGKAGEIRLAVRGGTQDYIACAQAGVGDTIPINSPAEVVAVMPPNTVYVKPASGA